MYVTKFCWMNTRFIECNVIWLPTGKYLIYSRTFARIGEKGRGGGGEGETGTKGKARVSGIREFLWKKEDFAYDFGFILIRVCHIWFRYKGFLYTLREFF